MSLVERLHRLGGVARRADLRVPRGELRRALASGAVVRDARGRYALPVAQEALRRANALSGVVSHRSAALYWGWEMKQPPEAPDVTVRRKRRLAASQASGVSVHYADLVPSDVVDGVTSQERTLLDCLRSLPFDEALAIADSALRHRALTRARLQQLADTMRGHGRAQARRVAREATHLAANPFESVLRAIALDVPGLDLRPQVVIRGMRPDLVDRGRRWVVEAESHSFHGRRGDLRRDCRRYTRLTLLGWRVLRFAWEDVMFHHEYVRECLLAAAALPVEPAQPARPGDAAA